MRVLAVSLLLASMFFCHTVICEEIHEAVRNGDVAKVKALLTANPELAILETFYDAPPLCYAAVLDHKEVAELLLAYKADVNAKDQHAKVSALHRAAGAGKKDVAELLIENGADVKAITGGAEQTPLHFAVIRSHKDVVELLIARGADLNTRDKNDMAPMDYALESANKELVKFLLEKKAAIDTKERYGARLHTAARLGRKSVAELLLSLGADVDAKDNDGKSPLDETPAPQIDILGGRHYTSQQTEMAEWLISRGADVNSKDKNGKQPLHWAASLGHKGVAEVILAHGGDPNAKDKDGKTPLELASQGNHKDVVELLQRHTGKCGIAPFLWAPWGVLGLRFS